MDNKSARELLINYLGGRCSYCGVTDYLELHHTLPLYAGGRNVMGNIELVCNDCHHKLHAQLIKLYPAAGQDKKLTKRNLYKDADKAKAASALTVLIDKGIVDRDTLPRELRVLIPK